MLCDRVIHVNLWCERFKHSLNLLYRMKTDHGTRRVSERSRSYPNGCTNICLLCKAKPEAAAARVRVKGCPALFVATGLGLIGPGEPAFAWRRRRRGAYLCARLPPTEKNAWTLGAPSRDTAVPGLPVKRTRRHELRGGSVVVPRL